MEAELIDLADAVKSEINVASPFTIGAVTSVRKYQPRVELKDMEVLHVTVVPSAVSLGPQSRNKNTYDFIIDVAVQQKFNPDTPEADIDPLMLLMQEIQDLLLRQRPALHDEAINIVWTQEPLFSQEHMNKFNQLTTVTNFLFRQFR